MRCTIAIFNVPKNIHQKIIPLRSEKNMPSSSTNKSIQNESTQALFDYVTKQDMPPVTSTSGTSEISKTSKIPSLLNSVIKYRLPYFRLDNSEKSVSENGQSIMIKTQTYL